MMKADIKEFSERTNEKSRKLQSWHSVYTGGGGAGAQYILIDAKTKLLIKPEILGTAHSGSRSGSQKITENIKFARTTGGSVAGVVLSLDSTPCTYE
jgi:hypothetical protein